MRLSKRERVMLFGMLIAAVVVLFINFYYNPLMSKIDNLEIQSEDLSITLAERVEKKLLVDKVDKEIESMKEKTQESQKYLMSVIDEPEILSYMNGIISNKTIQQSITYNLVEDKNIYKSKDIKLSYNTSYSELKEILRQFEDGKYYTTLQKLHFKVDNAIAGEPRISEDGRITYLKEEKSPYQIEVEYIIRFYGIESYWNGSGEYDFMEGAKFNKIVE